MVKLISIPSYTFSVDVWSFSTGTISFGCFFPRCSFGSSWWSKRWTTGMMRTTRWSRSHQTVALYPSDHLQQQWRLTRIAINHVTCDSSCDKSNDPTRYHDQISASVSHHYASSKAYLQCNLAQWSRGHSRKKAFRIAIRSNKRALIKPTFKIWALKCGG